MGTDVDQRTAALFVFVQEYTPGGNGTTTDCGCLGIVDVTEGTCFCFCLQELGVASLTGLVADGQLLAVSLGGIQHLLGFHGVDCHGLFTHNVLACIQSIHSDKAMCSVGSQNVNHVDGLVFQQLLIVFIYSSTGCTVLGSSSFCSFHNDVTESNHFHLRDLCQRRHMLTVGDTAAADDTDSYLIICTNCHNLLPHNLVLAGAFWNILCSRTHFPTMYLYDK